MNAPARLTAYGLGLVAAFAAAYLVAGAVVPAETVQRWNRRQAQAEMTHGTQPVDHGAGEAPTRGEDPTGDGLSMASGGFVLAGIDAPPGIGTSGTLGVRLERLDSNPDDPASATAIRNFRVFAVRSDGTQFQTARPSLEAAGATWRTPWTWEAGGAYRVIVQFESADGTAVVLGQNIDVAGEFEPDPPPPTRTRTEGGITLSLTGDLVAGMRSTIEFAPEQAATGQSNPPETGELTVLRQGDLAVIAAVQVTDDESADHANGPHPGLRYAVTVPTPGRYLLFFQHQPGDEAHTEPFVLDASIPDSSGTHGTGTHDTGTDDTRTHNTGTSSNSTEQGG